MGFNFNHLRPLYKDVIDKFLAILLWDNYLIVVRLVGLACGKLFTVLE